MNMQRDTLRLASRGSPLALWQARKVKEALTAKHPALEVEITICRTTGDRNVTDPLSAIGMVGLFTTEVNNALLDGRADLAVHSLKDCPSELEEGVVLAAVLERSSPLDAFVPSEEGMTFDELPAGSTIATGSLRRRAQILAARSDLKITELRGNIDTRLKKRFEPGIDAVVMAEAALLRLELDTPRTTFDPDLLLPAVCQGIVGIASREGDERAGRFARSITHEETFAAAKAERGLLALLQGGCRVPAGAYAVLDGDAIDIRAVVASLDGRQIVKRRIRGRRSDPKGTGAALGRKILEAGGAAILEKIRAADGAGGIGGETT